jgi:hypothetical protein
MMTTSLRIERRMFVLGAVATLAGCAAKPITLDRQAMASVHRVALPTPGFPKRPAVAVLNGVATRLPGVLGVIGAVATAATMNNRRDALVAIFADKGFDGEAYFHEQLTARLAARKLMASAVPADASRGDFLEAYPAFPGDDALLDVVVTAYGLVAYDDKDSSPYRPAVGLKVRMIAADKSVLMQDTLLNLGIEADPQQPPDAPAVDLKSFTTFGDVRADPTGAVEAMKQAFDYAVDAVDRRLA